MRTFVKNQFRLMFFAVVTLVCAFVANAQQFKNLGGGANETAAMRLPDAATLGASSKAAVLPIKNRAGETLEIPVDNTENFRIALIAPDAEKLRVSLALPGEEFSDLRGETISRGVARESSQFGFDGAQYPAQVFSFARIATGTLRLRLDAAAEKSANGETAAYVVISSDSTLGLRAALNTLQTVRNRPIGFVVALENNGETAKNGFATVREATLTITAPGNKTTEIALAADKSGAATFTAQFTPIIAGQHRAQMVARGTTADGAEFVRTNEQLFAVAEAPAAISRAAFARLLDDVRFQIEIPIGNLKPDQKVLAYAEVWTRAAGKSEEPRAIAWLGGMTTVKNQFGNKRRANVALTFDSRWLGDAKGETDFELRNVRLQDPDYFTVLGTADAVSLAGLYAPDTARNFAGDATDEMRFGKRSAALDAQTAPGGKLLLVHGYCSGGNPWNPAQFANSAQFADFNQNRTHDQFAQLIRNFGAQFPSFGIVAHSQGGAASLHLYTYYWSGLDSAIGARLIQTVGTPYQGTALAGNLAAIGEIFGAGCGANYDLSYSGASVWLAGIPGWARAKVFYHTTSFTDVWYRYDYCQLASDLLLSDPDDGVVERDYAQLAGANNLGHKTGWCHTSGMRDPAQTSDAARNSVMNQNAAR